MNWLSEMRLMVVPMLLVLLLAMQGESLGQNRDTQHGKATLHDDGTKTETVKDMNKREITETTYDARGVVISKKTFLVNQNGDPIQGVIHDGAGTLVAKVMFGFDDLGRLKEERCVNTRGEVFRRVIHGYDPAGKRLRPQAFDYQVNAPNMKPASIDFTRGKAPPRGVDAGEGQAAAAPAAAVNGQPQIMSVSPSGYAQPVQSQQDAYRQAYEQQQQQQMGQAAQSRATAAPAAAAPREKEKRRGFWPFGKKDK